MATYDSKNMESHDKCISKHMAADLASDILRWLEILQDLNLEAFTLYSNQIFFKSSLPLTSPSTPYYLIDFKKTLTTRMCQQNAYYLIEVFTTLTSLLNLKNFNKEIQFQMIK